MSIIVNYKKAHLIKLTHIFTVLVLFPAGYDLSRGTREVGLGGAAISLAASAVL